MKVAVHRQAQRDRSRTIGQAMARGIKAHGDIPLTIDSGRPSQHDVSCAVMYGMSTEHIALLKLYRGQGVPVVVVDLGYWGRDQGGTISGYHKVAVNHWHPQDAQLRLPVPPDRWDRLGLTIKPWRRSGETVLVAGMGPKSQPLYELGAAQEWDISAIERIREVSKRKIVYRPKPGHVAALPPIPGTVYSPPEESLAHRLAEAWCVVTNHSNVGIDALVAGVPVFCRDGAARGLALDDLSRIEDPIYPSGRERLMHALAYCQWTVAEMEKGTTWNHLTISKLIR